MFSVAGHLRQGLPSRPYGQYYNLQQLMKQEIQEFINAYSKEVESNNAAIFAGAGLSMPAGFVNWKTLLRPLANELGLDIHREENLVALAQYYYNENGRNRNRINQILINEFGSQAQPTPNHEILVRLPISTYWTTNYDRLIELTLEQADKVPDVKYTTAQLATTKPRRDAIVYKMHGDVEHPDKAVLIKDDYESYHVKMEPFITALSGDLVSKTFLFIGFSFNDPNLDYILSRIRITYTENQRRHYCFLRSVVREEDESEQDFEYRRLKQALFINDLKRFNVKALLLDGYGQITEILKAIELKHKQRSIFIGGSAHDYGTLTREEAEKFIHSLSEELVKSGYRIISGFGVGVGSAVISGALETIYSNKKAYSDEQLVLRPFPQSVSGTIARDVLWEKYRQDMVSYAGIAIFMFGNKLVEGNVVDAAGVEQEFRIAVQQGCKVLPLGATGYIAEKLFSEVESNFDRHYPSSTSDFRRQFEKLGDAALPTTQLVDAVLKLVALIQQG